MSIQDMAALATALGVGSWIPRLWRLVTSSAAREMTRIESLEQLVDVLRRALDKSRGREDALAQVLGVLIFALRHIEDLSPVISDAIERAIEILEKAQNQLQHNSSGVAQ